MTLSLWALVPLSGKQDGSLHVGSLLGQRVGKWDILGATGSYAAGAPGAG